MCWSGRWTAWVMTGWAPGASRQNRESENLNVSLSTFGVHKLKKEPECETSLTIAAPFFKFRYTSSVVEQLGVLILYKVGSASNNPTKKPQRY
jgi:hypothetical protein